MSSKEKWVELFEKVVGRQPTSAEFLEGKKSDFDLKTIKSIAGVAANSPETVPSQHLSQDHFATGHQPVQPVQRVLAQPYVSVSSVKKTLTLSQKLKRVSFALLGLLLFGSGGAYYYFDQQTGPDVIVKATSQALESNDLDKITQLFSTSKETWSKEEAKGFLDYLSAEGIDLAAELEKLATNEAATSYNDQRGNKLFGLEATEKKLGIFRNYRLAIYPVELLVNTNFGDLTVNDQAIEKNQEVSLGQVKFAPQQLAVKAKTDLGELETTINLDLDSIEYNKAKLDLSTTTKTLVASMPDGLGEAKKIKLIVNGKEVADGLKADLDLFARQELEVSAKFSFEEEELVTEKSKFVFEKEEDLAVSLSLSQDALDKIDSLKKAKQDKEAKEKAEQALQASQNSSGSRWDADKDAQLAAFMVTWGNKMGQLGYVRLDSGQGLVSGGVGALMWQGSGLDARYSTTGVSDAYYTIVSAYSYARGDGKSHTYHFAILPDGSTTVIYSEQAIGAGYIVSKLNTDNVELRNGFASIVNQ